MGYHPTCKHTFQLICADPKRGLNRSGGPDPLIPRGNATGAALVDAVVTLGVRSVGNDDNKCM